MESDVQTRIKNKLIKAGWIVIKLIQTSWNAIPDLLCLRNGVTIFIEVKKDEKTKPDPLQEYRIEKLREAGFDVLVLGRVSDIPKHYLN